MSLYDTYQVHNADVAICSVHLKATGLKNEDLDESKQEATTVHKIATAVMKQLKNEKDIIVLGDFNMSPDCEGKPTDISFCDLRMHPAITAGLYCRQTTRPSFPLMSHWLPQVKRPYAAISVCITSAAYQAAGT